ncbi:unnamed protein product [Absidia cylindrospora]
MNSSAPLSDELLSLIFYTATNPVLWQTVTTRDATQFTRFVYGLQQAPPEKQLGHRVHSLHIHDDMTNAYLILLTKYLPALKTLSMDDARGIDTSIATLPQHCPHLKSLSIKHGSKVSHESLHDLAKHCPRLSSLVLERCPELSPRSFGCLKACPLLRSFVLDVGAFTKDVRTSYCLTHDLILALLALSSLTKLVLLRCPKGFCKLLFDEVTSKERKHLTSTMDTSETTATTACCWPDLNEFSVEGSNDVGELRVLNFLKAHPLLTKVTLDKIQVTDDFLDLIPTVLPRLEWLSLGFGEWITAEGLRQLVINCPHLSYVNVEGGRVQVHDFLEVDENRSSKLHETHSMTEEEYNSDHEDFWVLYLTYLDHNDIAKVRQSGMNPVRPHDNQQFYLPPDESYSPIDIAAYFGLQQGTSEDSESDGF